VAFAAELDSSHPVEGRIDFWCDAIQYTCLNRGVCYMRDASHTRGTVMHYIS
jgi:hypothetical protein